MNRHSLGALALLLSACGTLEGAGGGDTALPNNRTGPFRALTAMELDGGTCVLSSFTETLEDPDVVRGDRGEIFVYATRAAEGRRSIVRATLDRSLRVTDGPRAVLDDPAGVSSPSVTRTAEGWVMAFARAGRIEVAFSADGLAWTVRPVPLLVPDPGFGEGATLDAPSIARSPDGRWYLAYASADAVWIARGSAIDGPYARVDADPATPQRDPALAREERVPEGGAAELRRYGDPAVVVERTTTGRTLVRVYARQIVRRAVDGGAGDETAVALAASFDGVRFTRAATPAFSGRAETAPTGPAVLLDGPVRTWMFFGGSCGGATRGVRAAVAPGTEALPVGG